MAVADMIPTMDDKALATLRQNVARFEAEPGDKRHAQATELLPLIDAELADRLAKKPVKPKAVRAPRKPTAKALAAAAAAAEAAAAEAADADADAE